MSGNKRWCTLTDEELIDNVQRHLKYICKERRVPTMHIPAQPNEDFDLTLGELLSRFKILSLKQANSPASYTPPQNEYRTLQSECSHPNELITKHGHTESCNRCGKTWG